MEVRHVAREELDIGAAQAHTSDVDHNLTRGGDGSIDGLDAPLARAHQHERLQVDLLRVARSTGTAWRCEDDSVGRGRGPPQSRLTSRRRRFASPGGLFAGKSDRTVGTGPPRRPTPASPMFAVEVS